MSESEELLFAQGCVNKWNGGRGGCKKIGRNDKTYDKKYWNEEENATSVAEKDIRRIIAQRLK